MASYYKEKIKELKGINEELLKVNNELKNKCSILGSQVSAQNTVEFYKSQISNL